MSITVDIRGLGALAEDFARLSRGQSRRVLRQATMAGARVGRDAARDAAPVDEGDLKRNVVAASKRQNPPGTYTAGVRVRSGGKRSYANTSRNRAQNRVGEKYEVASPAYYWRFSELGTSKQPATPWIRPAWDSHEAEITDAVRERLASAIDEAIGRR